MTNEEAKVFLDNLKICINEHPIVADWLVEIANRKTEPQTFDKPPKCLGCLYSDLDKAFHPCASCENFSKYVGEISDKTEPQTERKE